MISLKVIAGQPPDLPQFANQTVNGDHSKSASLVSVEQMRGLFLNRIFTATVSALLILRGSVTTTELTPLAAADEN